MSIAGALTTEQATWQPKVNPWTIGVAVSLAAFMEALDPSNRFIIFASPPCRNRRTAMTSIKWRMSPVA
jgi:hypothetical protein